MSTIFGNIATNSTVSWKPEPDTRGTWTVLSSCLITMSLCVWTAVHLNIPERKKKSRQKWWNLERLTQDNQVWRHLGWLILGLIGPEMITFTAWDQRREARQLFIDVRGDLGQVVAPSLCGRIMSKISSLSSLNTTEILSDEESLPHKTSLTEKTFPKVKHQWTMTHAFYALMGGFVIDSTESRCSFMPKGMERVTLTPRGLELLTHAASGIKWYSRRSRNYNVSAASGEMKLSSRNEKILLSSIPDISETYILDKSKADGLTKTLVCLQALWFCIQCISRLAQMLPISLLELNTFGHSVCALISYFMWWNKPFNVSSPTELLGDNLREILAFMSVVDQMSREREADDYAHHWLFIKYSPSIENQSLARNSPTLECQRVNIQPESAWPLVNDARGTPNGSVRILPGQELLSTGLYLNGNSERVLEPKDVKRWILAAELYKDIYDELSRDLGDRKLGPLFQIRSENWPLTLKVSSEDFDMIQWAIFVLAGLIYGGLHALAWNAHFSSELEKSMWRMSAITIMSPGLIGLLIIISKNKIARWEEKTRMEPNWESTRSVMLWFGTVLMVILPCVGTCLFSAYIFARAYLVVECFISLAHSPPGIYDLPQWPTYFPHIT